MFGVRKPRELTPTQVKAGLEAGRIVLIDVREPSEFADERIAGALNVPLSSFDPIDIPPAHGKTIVLQCAGGKRSAMAVDRCHRAGALIDAHLAGGIGAWKAEGLPTVAG